VAEKPPAGYAVGMSDLHHASPYDDEENLNWKARFGAPYVEDDYLEQDLDEGELQRLEREFLAAADESRTPFGDLETIDGAE
jgi:hypothetical protein